MITKGHIRKAGYKAIVKENKSHQEAFDELSTSSSVDKKMLADELSKIPSSGRQNATSNLRSIFIGALVILIGLRLWGIVTVSLSGFLDAGIILIMVLFSVFVPALGIYGALASKAQVYRTTGFLLGINIIRAISSGGIYGEPKALITFGFIAIAIGLAFYIPSQLKTGYKKVMTEHYKDGQLMKQVKYSFEDTRARQSDILDGNSFS